ncbi:MAG: hypothetical protein KGZ70_13050 [Hydrogenophaga sp.]|nr:hypothetical protein [Hydrogenophaga sp.]
MAAIVAKTKSADVGKEALGMVAFVLPKASPASMDGADKFVRSEPKTVFVTAYRFHR